MRAAPRRVAVRLAGGSALVALGLLIGSPGAHAHASFASSTPAPNATIGAAPESVTITFTEAPEPKLSSIRVIGATGESFEAGRAEVVVGEPRSLRAGIRSLGEGVYTVSWRVVSKVDGHLTAGAFAFGVGVDPLDAPPPVVPEEETPSTSAVEVAGRAAFLAGVALLIGAAWVGAIAFRAPPRPVRSVALGGAVVSLAGLSVLAIAQRTAAGVGFGDLLGTSIGRALAGRAIALGAAIALATLAWRSAAPERRRRALLLASGAAAAAAAGVHVGAGHAAAAPSGPLLRVLAQWTHVVAAGVWLGGLAALLAGVRGAASEEKARAVRRFSQTALAAFALVLATGVLRALEEVGSWRALTGTSYGQAVIVKALALGGLLALAAINRYRSLPVAGRSLRGLRTVSRGELALALVAVAAAGVLASVVPPRGAEPAEAASGAGITAEGSDFGTTVRATLEIAPGTPGPNRFSLTIADYDTGEPVDARRVVLRFAPDAGADIEETSLVLDPGGEGRWRGTGSNMPVPARWRITVRIEQAADSVEVPIVVLSRCRATAQEAPGQPTIHSIEISGGDVQMYADPGRAGSNEVHVTYFDDAGSELPVERLPRIVGIPEDGDTVELSVRRFSPGHFVGAAALTRGRWLFDFAVPGVDGLSGCFTEVIAE